MTAIENVMAVTMTAKIIKIMNNRIIFGQKSLYIVPYLGCASGWLHESVLAKLLNSFFTSLPESNLLSSNDCASQAHTEQFSQRVDYWTVYYCSSKYDMAWNNACHDTLEEKYIPALRRAAISNVTHRIEMTR